MKNFQSRWGIDQSPAEEWGKFKKRLKVVIGDPKLEASPDEIKVFAFRLGQDTEDIASPDNFGHSWFLDIGDLIDDVDSDQEIAEIVESLLNSIEYGINADQISKYINNNSSGIRISQSKQGWVTYPRGEKMLDEKLVEKPLNFLDGQALIEFKKALGHYKFHRWEESAEKARRTIEEYLRNKLNSRKSGDGLINELSKKLS